MLILDLFSKRRRRERGEDPDVYVYDDVPHALRVQIVHIWNDALGSPDQFHERQVAGAYRALVHALRREYGVFHLPGTARQYSGTEQEELVNFLLNEPDVERVLDAVELSFRVIDNVTRDWDYLNRFRADEIASGAIEELNARCREHCIGYQYSDGELIRVDSEFIHSQAVKPALGLLRGKQYAGAQEEFLKAHEYYRSGNTKEALSESLKAYESVMRSICDKRKWPYRAGATAKELIEVCLSHDLIPSFWQSHYSALRSVLESGVPTGRNKLGGHGQGTDKVEVPVHIAGYVLHMTASAIVFLVEADASMT